MMGKYILEGLSEEQRVSDELAKLQSRRATLKNQLSEVTTRLDESMEKRRQRMKKELFYAKNELDRVKLRLSDDPYRNRAVDAKRSNKKNVSKLSKFAFPFPKEVVRSTTQEVFTPRLLKDGEVVNGNISFARGKGEFTDYVTKSVAHNRMCGDDSVKQKYF